MPNPNPSDVPEPAPTVPLARRALAEALGTGLLVTIVVGSGIMAQRLCDGNVGLELLANSTATALGLAVLILVLGPVSGAHFNPVVTIADLVLNRQPAATGARVAATGAARQAGVSIAAQFAGGIGGALLANAMFGLSVVGISTHIRSGVPLWLGEVVATAGLILLVFSLGRTGKSHAAPAAVGAYIGAAYWFTSSTSFANPAVTVAREFTDTFAGIAPSSVAGFILAQLLGAAIGAALVAALYPRAAATRTSATHTSTARTSTTRTSTTPRSQP
ncbi:aquaporin [Actinospica durhamensis]|uniref:Aquaporin n=1 Tax=Actinospica durhamensis TaxID=1508375 RepID=A0A941EQF8_9ACTN|nr:aquaporin [Actinospica durhamensis]